MKKKCVDIEVLAERLQAVHDNVLEVKELVKSQNGRIGKLENYRSFLLGACGLLMFLVSVGLVKIFGGG